MGAIKKFRDERNQRITDLKENKEFDEVSLNWTKDAFDIQFLLLSVLQCLLSATVSDQDLW